MNETQKRIRAYKAALPGLKERVFAVALLLAMSVAMMTSATFAWLTISRRPEVTGVSTNITANGNLEIALATGDGTTVPGDSQVGDSSATEGQTLTGANITWGNLVNLSDASYGLENLTLRPAQLNEYDLLGSPLYGAEYDGDGRITQLASDFAYTSWSQPDPDIPGEFIVSNKLGVRAISSTKVEATGAAVIQERMLKAAEAAHMQARSTYIGIAQNDSYMNTLAYLVGTFMTAKLNDSDPSLDASHIANVKLMYGVFEKAFNEELEAIVYLANLNLWLQYGNDDNGQPNYTPYTTETILNETEASLEAKGIQITKFDEFKKDRATIISDKAVVEAITGSQTWESSHLSEVVNRLVNANACTLDGTPIGNIGVKNAMSYLDGKSHDAVITNGVLKNFEDRTGARLTYDGLEISAKYIITVSLKANITTSSTSNYFADDQKVTEAKPYNGEKTEMARDTYGLAVDLWVRTNTVSTYLTLEGNVLSTSHEESVMGRDANGNEVQIYTLTRTVETDGEDNAELGGIQETYTVDVYTLTAEDGTQTWYEAETHAQLTEEDLGGATPIKKVEEVVTVIGYEGENRVWGDNTLLTVDSTTQGGGSCYVYYADTPEDQARSLKLLEAMHVAFVDADGNLLAIANMDTEHVYAESGRVTVPLVLDPSKSIKIGTDSQGVTTYGITELNKNEATRITAIVYLDGTRLSNDNVLAASDIHGQLNIQFGSSTAMNPISNEDLENEERKVSASVDKTSFNYDTATEPMTTKVTVHVDGQQPTNVTAFFLRSVSSTQGSREETMIFQPNANGDWEAEYTFKVPGNYILRSVQLDGKTYDLETVPQVAVEGFTIASLSCTEADENNHVRVMSAESRTTVNLSLKFASNDASKLPKKVQGRYYNDDTGAAVNVDFTLNATTQLWSGSATFINSGDYTLKNLVLDGEYVELDAKLWQTADVTLGMRVALYTSDETKFKFIPAEMQENGLDLLDIQMMIVDNSGKEMPGLSGVKLTYGLKGSSVKTLDADMTWNGEYYVGSLKALEGGPGIWRFSNVTVGSNMLTNATASPEFTMISTDPPEYYSFNPQPEVFAPNGGATMNVQLKYSATAAIKAYILQEETGTVHEIVMDQAGTVLGTDENVNNWNIPIPTASSAKTQDGTWTLLQVDVFNAYDKSGNEYTEDDPLVIDMRDKNHTTKVIQTITVEFTEDKSYHYGRDGGTATGEITADFMTSHSITGLNVDIYDFQHQPISSVANVKLTVEYIDGSSKNNGGYTSDNLLSGVTSGTELEIPLNTVNGTNYAQTDAVSILYAGNYYTTLTFDAGTGAAMQTYEYGTKSDADHALPKNGPVFSVWSKKPTVKITGVSPTGTQRYYNTATPSSIESDQLVKMTDLNKKVDDYTAAVYMNATWWEWSIGNANDQEALTIVLPKVSLSLSGVPSTISSASVSIGHPNSAYTHSAAFTNGTAQIEVGGAVNGTYNGGITGFGYNIETYPQLYPAGKQEIKQITVVYNGMTFAVNLSHTVTINNPLIPPKLSYAISDSTFTGTVPSAVYSADGETITVTLPTVSSWTQAMEATVNPTYSDTPDNETYATVHTKTANGTGGSGCSTYPVYDFVKYTQKTAVYTAMATKTIWTNTKQVVGWRINGVTYAPGQTVSLDASTNLTAVAVVETAEGAKTTTNTTYTKTVVTYAATGEKAEKEQNVPDGYGSEVSSVTGTTTETHT